MELVPIKIKIGLKPNGNAKYPDFNSMPAIKSYGGDWSNYVDEMGLSWHYDKTCGHKEDSLDSPKGQQFGMLVVPEAFALEAIARFSDVCSRLTELECEDFYDNKAHAHEADNIQDDRIITGLKDTLDLMERTGSIQGDVDKMKLKIQKALDPADAEPGIKKNNKKKWSNFKGDVNVTIKNPV